MCFHRSLLCTRIGFSSIVFVKLAKTPLVFTIAFRFCPVQKELFSDFVVVGWLVGWKNMGFLARQGLSVASTSFHPFACYKTKNMATIPRENGLRKSNR